MGRLQYIIYIKMEMISYRREIVVLFFVTQLRPCISILALGFL